MPSGLKHTHYWQGAVVPPPPPPPDEDASHSPHDWRAVNPRMRKRILRGVLPEEFALEDVNELEELMRLLDDLDNLLI